MGYYIKAHGPSAPRPKAHLLINIYIYIYIYIYNIYIYWVGPPRGAHGEETHPPLVGLHSHHLFKRAFFNIYIIKNPLPSDVGQEVLFLKKILTIQNPTLGIFNGLRQQLVRQVGCQESRVRNLLEIRIFRFHVIKVVFKETYQFMTGYY